MFFKRALAKGTSEDGLVDQGGGESKTSALLLKISAAECTQCGVIMMETNRDGWSELDSNKRPNVHNVKRLHLFEAKLVWASSPIANARYGAEKTLFIRSHAMPSTGRPC